jgi:hypothetical protein
MRYELWYSESASSYGLLYEGDTASDHLKEPDAKVIWTVEAEKYEDALQKRNDFLGWDEYKSQGILFDYPPRGRYFNVIELLPNKALPADDPLCRFVPSVDRR